MGNGPSNLARTFSEDIGEVREIIFIVCLVLSSRYITEYFSIFSSVMMNELLYLN